MSEEQTQDKTECPPESYHWIVPRHFYRNKEVIVAGIRSNPVNFGDNYRDE